MENIVPGTLQRLRAADIIRMAGLASASLGQEYCRTGSIHSTQRQGARISGVVTVLHMPGTIQQADQPVDGDVHAVTQTETKQRHFAVEVEIRSLTAWVSICQCSPNTALLCPHAAALLYQWLARPAMFISEPIPDQISAVVYDAVESVVAAPGAPEMNRESEAGKDSGLGGHRPLPARTEEAVLTNEQTSSETVGDLTSLLAQSGLSELRAIAREYGITPSGMTKQKLVDLMLDTLQQPEAIRRVAATLEKPQRQLLAALTLAGGSMIDDDLRGLFERFSLGHANQLQKVLLILQGKALLFRTNIHGISSSQNGLSGALLDVGWYVPQEIRAALRVTVPVTVFKPEVFADQDAAPLFQQAESYTLLADLLLVARAVDGYRLGPEDVWHEPAASYAADTHYISRSGSPLVGDGSMPIPVPMDTPPAALMRLLLERVPRSPAFLHFAVSLLRLAGILHKDDNGQRTLRVLPNAGQLLLGTAHAEILRDLFELWRMQAGYAELFSLHEHGLRLRCRSTSLHMPILRSGELDSENREARQTIISLLAQTLPEQWISFPAFARFVYRLNPLFLEQRQRLYTAPHWWIEQDEGRPLRPLQLSDWLRAEIYFVSHLLTGPLHWMGACDIALTPDGRLQAFRLTTTAEWLFHGIQQDEELRTQQAALAVDSLKSMGAEISEPVDILVPCVLASWPIIELLEIFTEAAGVSGDRLRYRFTPRTLGEALSRGQRPTYLLELLRTVAEDTYAREGTFPQILTQLDQWIASYGRVRIYTGVTLLETSDAVVMRELSATTSLDEQIVQTIHPTLHILKSAATERITEEAKRRGPSPLLHDEEFYGAE